MATQRKGLSLLPGDPILLELSSYFTSDREVIGLATFLLENLGQGGRAFVENLPSQSATMKAHAVLEEWAKRKPEEAFGKTLLSVLYNRMVNPSAARLFENRLLASPNRTGIVHTSVFAFFFFLFFFVVVPVVLWINACSYKRRL